MYRRAFMIVGILLATGLLFGMAAQAKDAQPFRIGVSVSLTGVFGKDGSLVKDAYSSLDGDGKREGRH